MLDFLTEFLTYRATKNCGAANKCLKLLEPSLMAQILLVLMLNLPGGAGSCNRGET